MNIIEEQKDELNISDFITQAESYSSENFPELDIGSLFENAIQGELSYDSIVQVIFSLLGSEVVTAINLLGMILVIIVIGSILKIITDGLGNESAAQIAYFVQYILIVTLMLFNFSEIIYMARETIDSLITFLYSLLPILIVLMITTGSIISASLVQPVILFFIAFIGNLIANLIIPFILVGTILGIVSNISDKIEIDKIAGIFKSSILWILGISLTLFVSVLSLEGTLSSSVDGITAKTAKAAVTSLIPVVGKAIGESADAILGGAVILKNAVGLIGIIVIISIVVLPIIKLTILSIVYTIASALAQPIADKKIVKLLDQFGDTFKILLGIVFLVSAMFIIGVAIIINMSNSGMMYR